MEQDVRLGTTLKAAVLAGLLAGLLVAGFHFAITELVIDRAITLEEAMNPSTAGEIEPVVSRPVQRAGLFLGYLMIGLSWSLLFAVAFHLLQRRLPATGAARRGLVLALAAYWAVALLPFLKYPANPPGVGDPETISYRGGLYLAILVLGIATSALAVGFGHWIKQILPRAWAPWAAGMSVAMISGVLLVAVMPPSPDPVRMPEWVVTSFRALSLVGSTLFWMIMGTAFAFLVTRLNGRPSRGAV